MSCPRPQAPFVPGLQFPAGGRPVRVQGAERRLPHHPLQRGAARLRAVRPHHAGHVGRQALGPGFNGSQGFRPVERNAVGGAAGAASQAREGFAQVGVGIAGGRGPSLQEAWSGPTEKSRGAERETVCIAKQPAGVGSVREQRQMLRPGEATVKIPRRKPDGPPSPMRRIERTETRPRNTNPARWPSRTAPGLYPSQPYA